jgi:hypothetical protein
VKSVPIFLVVEAVMGCNLEKKDHHYRAILKGPYTFYIFISIGFSPDAPALVRMDPTVFIFSFNFSVLHYKVKGYSDYQKCEWQNRDLLLNGAAGHAITGNSSLFATLHAWSPAR